MREVSNPSVAKLSQKLEKEMERLGYSMFCIGATQLLSRQLSIFMEEHEVETYDICVGAKFQDDYCQHHTGKRQLTGVKLFIARINSIFNERGFVAHRKLTVLEAIYKKYLYEAKQQHPSMFRETKYSPHSIRHTAAMHMLEAGVPMMAIKNFLGHASVTTTERYAELSQSTVDTHIKEWNQRWFSDTGAMRENMEPTVQEGGIPRFSEITVYSSLIIRV